MLGVGAVFLWVLGGYLFMRSELPEPTRKMWALAIVFLGAVGALLFILFEWPSQRRASRQGHSPSEEKPTSSIRGYR